MKKLLLAGCFIVASVVSTQAQRWEEIEQFNPEFNHGSGTWMGFSVAIDGSLAAVGVPEYNDSKGIVGIYQKEDTEWKLLTTIRGGNGRDEFGTSVGISGTIVVVGGYSDSLVYVYRQENEWAIAEKITLPEKENDHLFGRSVAIHDSTMVVSAEGADEYKGAVYIFEKENNEWKLSQKLAPSERVEGERFGHAVDISQDHILVGAMHSNAAYIFERTESEWKQSARLSVPFSSDYVVARPNSCVSILDDIAVVGTPYNSDSNWRAGAAFVFEKKGDVWKQTVRLDASDVDRTRVYGHSVSVGRNAIVIGSWGRDGGAYLYEKEGGQWNEVRKVVVDSTHTGDHNFSVAMSGSNIVTGGPFSGAGESGSAFFLERHPLSWHNVRVQKVDITDYPVLIAAHQFGKSVALSENIAVVGAPDEDTSGKKSGAAYIYKTNGGQLVKQTKLIPEGFWQIDGHRFGSAVSIHNKSILIGASSYYGGRASDGTAYIFTETDTGWVQTAKMVSEETSPGNNNFGRAVALHGNTAMISASRDSTSTPVIYVFEKGDSSWVAQTKLAADDDNPEFGASLALEDSIVVVGAPGWNCDRGDAYVFSRNGSEWTQTAKLAPKDSVCNFGGAVAILGNTIIVGASSGESAYIFERSGSTWTQIAKLTAGRAKSGYGNHKWVAISDKYALVGSPGGSAVYTFVKPDDGWKDVVGVSQIAGTDRSEDDHFGASIALSGDTVLIGAPHGRYQQGGQSGKAYFFETGSAGQPPSIEDQVFDISSGNPDSTYVGTVKATDPENDQLFFRIISGDPDRDFSIDPLTGSIFLEDDRILNWTNVPSYHLTVGVGDGVNIVYATITITINAVTAIDEQPLEKLYSVYPNPTKGKISLRFDYKQTLKENKIVVINSVGSIVLTKEAFNNETVIDLSQHPSGIYLLYVEGGYEETTKIIKK